MSPDRKLAGIDGSTPTLILVKNQKSIKPFANPAMEESGELVGSFQLSLNSEWFNPLLIANGHEIEPFRRGSLARDFPIFRFD